MEQSIRFYPGHRSATTMFRTALWCSGLLVLVLRVSHAEMPLHSRQQPAVPAPPRLVAPVDPAYHAPQYLILRQATGGVAQPTVGQPYAYGWFGVAPRRHTITHRGYYGGQWLFTGRIAP
jgi:hypothetical protein